MTDNRSAVLYIDDEEQALKYFRRSFEKKFSVLTANSAQEGFDLLAENADNIGVLMTDQRMPGEGGLSVLSHALEKHPEITRILVTAYSDHSVAVDAINKGKIFEYVEKPWDINNLVNVLEQALVVHDIQKPCWQSKGVHDILLDLVHKNKLPAWMTEMSFKQAKRKLNDIFEKCYLAQALENTDGNVSKAAQISAINRRTIQRINKRLQIR